MSTDVDQLHKAIDDPGTWSARRSGKTTIQIHELAGQIQVDGQRDIYVVIRYFRDCVWLFPKIKEIFEEQGIEIIHPRSTKNRWIVSYKRHEIKVTFFSVESFDHGRAMRGVDAVEVNLVDYGYQLLSADYLKELKLCTKNLYTF